MYGIGMCKRDLVVVLLGVEPWYRLTCLWSHSIYFVKSLGAWRRLTWPWNDHLPQSVSTSVAMTFPKEHECQTVPRVVWQYQDVHMELDICAAVQ